MQMEKWKKRSVNGTAGTGPWPLEITRVLLANSVSFEVTHLAGIARCVVGAAAEWRKGL
jgi:hypothetical protein